MAYVLTEAAKLAASQTAKTPNLIIDIIGVGVFGYFQDLKTLKFDDGYDFDEGLFFDTPVPNNTTYPFVSKSKTTKRLTQQLNQDKGGTGSIPSMKVSLIDYRGIVTDLIGTKELLGVKCNAYLSFDGLEHPKDSIRIFSGVINGVESLAGEYVITIDNPDSLKRQELFIQYVDELTAPIDNVATALQVRDNANFIGSQAELTSYLRVDDEIMRVNIIGGSSTDFAQVTRGELGTTPAAHDDEAEIVSVYRLVGNPIELALAIMLSKNSSDGYYETDAFSFEDIGSQTFTNSIIIEEFNVADEQSITAGDIAEIKNSNGVDGQYLILDVGVVSDDFSFVKIDGFISPSQYQIGTTVEFFSQYNSLSEGCGMSPDEVDVAQHKLIDGTFGAQFPTVDVLLDDTINAKDFIEKELYAPIAAYFIPRKGRASVGYTAPAVAGEGSITLSADNISKASKIKVKRSTNKNFYNSVIYKFGYDIVRNKFTDNIISTSEDSVNRIRTGSTPLTIETKSYAAGDINRNFFSSLSLRLLDRYRFAATHFTVEPSYGIGYGVEVGDILLLDGTELQIYDSNTGRRDTFKRLMEVTNKTLDITSGKVSLEMTDTNFALTGRYCSVSPSSYIDSGSTTTRLKIKKSFGTSALENEFEKWTPYAGQPIQVRDVGFTFQETITFIGIDPTDVNFMLVSALSIAPSEDYIIEFPTYDESSDFNKLLHGSLSPRIDIVSGVDNFSFDVSPSDIGKFFVGSVLDIHTYSFAGDRAENAVIESISTNTITVTESLGFTPDNTYSIDKIGFSSDNGEFYLYF